MTQRQLTEWYASQYHNGVYEHDYQHDVIVAHKRIEAYASNLNGPALDVGCGNGAFRDACLSVGIDAYGQDLGGNSADFMCDLHKHDVVEHVPNVMAFLRKCRKICRGNLIIDFPDFFCPEGLHHWKPVEHLWYFTRDQLDSVLRQTGFCVHESYKPIPGKFVVIAK
jgi:hypothetical protein